MQIRSVLAPLTALVVAGCSGISTPTPSTTTTGAAPTRVTAPPVAWPDATNTGVPRGTALTASGPLTLNITGQVVEGLDIRGSVTINASDVVLRRSRVASSSQTVIRVENGATGVRIEDVEVDGNKGAEGSTGISGPATVLRTDIRGVENGVQPQSGSLIQASWIHDLGATGRPHVDGIQIDGERHDITVRHNTIDLRGWTQTAAVMIDNYSGPASNIIVDRNRLLGGGFTLRSDGRFGGGPMSGLQFTNNRIGYGYWGHASMSVYDPVWSGNVDDRTGDTIPQP